jgi:uncharacterized protein involved in tolerance to divalent cations
MSLASEVNNPAIDNLVESSLESKKELLRLKWISCSDITDIEPTPTNAIYYASRKHELKGTMHLLLGSSEECTPALVSEFARIYSLPTHKYNNVDNNFKRYSEWLSHRNKLINGFTKYEDKFYMVADKRFYHCYSRYGFCTACGTLRSSPVWCICGHKQVSDGWTSNNKQLDEFIKKSQLQTNSANDAYLEWIPFDCIGDFNGYQFLYGHLPTRTDVKLIPLEITDSTHDLYYAEVNYLLMRHVY